ncbi:hypothetical protein CgunFtcFv8_013332 [Champsocephalus gunnari]|uniref:Uncharacterized protein n=1 Tax=Champsocephalus gunnari TaxID=52237 RepID=A0AAN8DS88_CHAGU|nr:hypothetical protein CgunFtcFv8_013332 [Champsocephalus gunnari]
MEIEKDSSYKAEPNTFPFQTQTLVVSEEPSWQSSLFFGAAASSRVLLLSDVHSDSYRLPPAVQSVPLQWILPLQA